MRMQGVETVRTAFSSVVALDADGKASVDIKMPADRKKWSVRVHVVSENLRFGSAETFVTVRCVSIDPPPQRMASAACAVLASHLRSTRVSARDLAVRLEGVARGAWVRARHVLGGGAGRASGGCSGTACTGAHECHRRPLSVSVLPGAARTSTSRRSSPARSASPMPRCWARSCRRCAPAESTHSAMR